MIVKNEASVLARCLDSVRGAVDEIVIADTGSTDETPAIARRYTDMVYPFAWRDDFSAARNFCFSKATGDYLMWMDADDVLTPDMLPRLSALRARIQAANADMVVCKYVSGNLTYLRERIVRRDAGFCWAGRVHECIPPHGAVIYDELTITHLPTEKPRGSRNLAIYEAWRAEEPLSPRDMFYYGRELYYARRYADAKTALCAMLDGDGWYVNKIEACKVLSACHAAEGEREKAIKALLQSFLYGAPRADVCCALGKHFRESARYREAVFWYEAARTCGDHTREGDFEDACSRTLYPLLGLVCSHWALGQTREALACHEACERLAPNHPAVVYNRAFFAQGTKP